MCDYYNADKSCQSKRAAIAHSQRHGGPYRRRFSNSLDQQGDRQPLQAEEQLMDQIQVHQAGPTLDLFQYITPKTVINICY